jgi:hypothetical protein
LIFGAEGAIALINIVLLLGAIATLILLGWYVWRKKYQPQKLAKKLSLGQKFLIGFLLIIALPAWFAGGFALITYVKDKPYNDAFERNNKNFEAMQQTMQEDNLATFKQALTVCGDYCIGTPNPGARKYDTLIINAEYAKAIKIKQYLAQLNQTEKPQPEPDHTQFYEIK